ncbi:DNA polymerase III subunit delta [Fulvimarina pelagi HTCC2506]|uniref:DNA polymerase III subunit delta n=1 Tax=Fulvimarina pelagi HTCC2506 TaxID=314231 RepID=Q0G739_9HYPH|nr:DNA polymerase III subunit delta' [Fulvimarina pelagi]EAU42525.1 DNA polymerase III subunit delta [Fulvimarina pelagi HTCC2506]
MDIATQAEHDDLDGVPPPKAQTCLIGHYDMFEEFRSAFAGGRLHHAWLLQGPRGVGKATTAFAFARLLLGVEPVVSREAVTFPDQGAVTRQIATDAHPGLIHVTRAAQERGTGFRSQITVDEVRRLARFFHATGVQDGYRIAIIDPADDMNRNAANALLKMLEEPPRRAVFFLINHAPGRLLPTIRSRCRFLRFAELGDEALLSAIRTVKPDAASENADVLVHAAEGSVRRALQIAEYGGVEILKVLEPLLAAHRPDWNAMGSMADQLSMRGREASYDLAVEVITSTIAKASEAALRTGAPARAAELSALWQSEKNRIREAAAYNLDRKQVLLTLYDRFHEANSNEHADRA